MAPPPKPIVVMIKLIYLQYIKISFARKSAVYNSEAGSEVGNIAKIRKVVEFVKAPITMNHLTTDFKATCVAAKPKINELIIKKSK